MSIFTPQPSPSEAIAEKQDAHEEPDSAQVDTSLEALEAQAARSPDDVGTQLMLAAAYRERGQSEKAIAAYEKVLALDEGHQAARVSLAEIYLGMGRYDECIAQLDVLLQNDPDHQLAHYLYGLALGTGKQDYQGAVAHLRKYVELAPNGLYVLQAKTMISQWQKMQAGS